MVREKKVNQLEMLNVSMLVGVPVSAIEGRILSTPYGEMIDYCNTNYLGFDNDPELHRQGSALGEKWGSLVGVSRLEADATIFTDLEKRISGWLGSKEVILGHTITVTGFSVMPKLAEHGIMLTDSKLHTVVYEACRLAKAHGATLERFKHQDLDDLESKLKKHKDLRPKLILVDGVYSISAEKAPLRELQTLCKKYDAWLYVDDAHGFGMLGRDSTPENPYGLGGRGSVDFCSLSMDRIFYVSSFAKAFCTHYAFISVPKDYREMLRENCMQYIFSTPPSPYDIGVINAVMDLNEREGDHRRATVLRMTQKFVAGLKERNLCFLNDSYFPIVFWKIGSVELLAAVAKEMYSQGVIAGLRAYPVVPADECGIRFGLTALHTEDQIKKTLSVIDSLFEKFPSIPKNI